MEGVKVVQLGMILLLRMIMINNKGMRVKSMIKEGQKSMIKIHGIANEMEG
jgi:hypothetical protein